jgi:hypothetical protein
MFNFETGLKSKSESYFPFHHKAKIILALLSTAIISFGQAQIGASINEIAASGSQVLSSDEKELIVKNTGSAKVGDNLIFVRLSEAKSEARNFEIIARGKVEKVNGALLSVKLDPLSVQKRPIKGDSAVGLSKPYVPGPSKYLDPPLPPVQSFPIDDAGDPGFFQMAWGAYSGSLHTQNSILSVSLFRICLVLGIYVANWN